MAWTAGMRTDFSSVAAAPPTPAAAPTAATVAAWLPGASTYTAPSPPARNPVFALFDAPAPTAATVGSWLPAARVYSPPVSRPAFVGWSPVPRPVLSSLWGAPWRPPVWSRGVDRAAGFGSLSVPQSTLAVQAQAQRPVASSGAWSFAVTTSSWSPTVSSRTGGAMGMDVGLAHLLANVLKRTRSALDDVVAVARHAQELAQLNMSPGPITLLGDQAWSVGTQVGARADALENHDIAVPRTNNLGTGPLTSPTTGSLTSLTGSDRNLLNYVARANTADRVQGGTGQLPTSNQRFMEVNTDLNYELPASTIGVAATLTGADRALFNRIPQPGSSPQPTGWEGYSQLPAGEFEGIANPGPNPNPTIDLNAAIAAVSGQFVTPLTPVRAVDVRTAEIGEIRDLWDQADRLTDSAGDEFFGYMDYVQSGLEAESNELRQQAWDRVEAFGGDPQAVLGYIVHTGASDREIARATELARAQRLHDSADSLASSTLGFEAAAMRTESEDILSELFLTSETKNLVDQLGSTLSPYETAAVIEYAKISADSGQAIVDSGNPMRVLEVIGLGYSEQVALDHVADAPTTGLGAKTFAELETDLATMEAANDTNRYEFDATLAELNERSQAISGEIYVRTDLDATRISDRSGFGYGDSLAIVIDARLDNVSDHPGARDAQLDAIQQDLETFVEVRHQEKLDERNAIYEFAVDPVAPMGDPSRQAGRLLAIINAGASVGEAEWFSGALGTDASGFDAASVFRDAQQLEQSVEDGDFSDAALVAVMAHQAGIDAIDVGALASDEKIGLISAFVLSSEANRRDMTVDELTAYQGLYEPETFAAIDNITGGDADGKVSLVDLTYAVEHGDEMGLDEEIISAAAAFLDQPDLMSRLDTARDFSENVMEGDGFGRDRLDDGLFSLEDQQAFELKQDVNFLLGDLADTIDTAALGGVADGDLSRQDVQATLARAEELELTEAEIDALQTVLDGKMYDQGWIEKNRDSIAIATAVLAGTFIFVASGGTAAGLSATLIGAAWATGTGAVVAGGVTYEINNATGVDSMDGVLGNAFKGGIVSGLAAPGLAMGGSGWAGAGLLGRTGITLGLAGEGAGLVGAGALDWAIDPFYDGDSIDMNNIHSDADQYSLLLAGGSAVASVGSVVGRKLAVDSVTETLDLAESEFVRQLDAVVPPTGTTYSGSTTRLNNPAFGTERALDPTAYKESFHRYTDRLVPGLYLGTDAATAAAETAHHVGDISGHVRLTQDVHLDNLLDLTDPGVRAQLGVTTDMITGDSYDVTQTIGEWALANGYDGILAPSARLDGGTNLVAFTPDLGNEAVDNALRHADELGGLADDAVVAAEDALDAVAHADHLASQANSAGLEVLDDAIAGIDDAHDEAAGLLEDAIEFDGVVEPELVDGLLDDAVALESDAIDLGDNLIGDAAQAIDDAFAIAEDTALEAQAAVDAAEAAVREADTALAHAQSAHAIQEAAEEGVDAAREQLRSAQAARDLAAGELRTLIASGQAEIRAETGELLIEGGRDIAQGLQTPLFSATEGWFDGGSAQSLGPDSGR